jgi:hypothetical protein
MVRGRLGNGKRPGIVRIGRFGSHRRAREDPLPVYFFLSTPREPPIMVTNMS